MCFGKKYAKTSPECIKCRAPVVQEGEVMLFKDLCALRCQGTKTKPSIKKLTSQEFIERIERGVPLKEVFNEILGNLPPKAAAAYARQLLVDRAYYLKTIGIDVGPIPTTKELLTPEK